MANYALPQGAARLGYRTLGSPSTNTYTEIPFKALNITDNSVEVDTTTTNDRASGVQYTSSMTTAVGMTLDVESLRFHDSGATPDAPAWIQFFEDLWAKNGSLRMCELELIPPETYALSGGTGGGAYSFKFVANLVSFTGLGGGVTDAAGVKLQLKSVGTITIDNTLP